MKQSAATAARTMSDEYQGDAARAQGGDEFSNTRLFDLLISYDFDFDTKKIKKSVEDSEILKELASHPEAAKEYGRWDRGAKWRPGRFNHYALDLSPFRLQTVQFLPLQVAIVFQRSDALIKALFEVYREAAKKVTNCGLTVLHLAVSSKVSNEVVKTLLGAHTENLNLSSLQRALWNGNLNDIMTVLAASYREEVKKTTEHYRFTALHLALATNASVSVVEMLLALYPDATKDKSTWSYTPLHMAIFSNASAAVVKMLLEACPDAAKILNFHNETPLHVAAAKNASAAVVKMILEACPDATKELDNINQTPLDLALRHNAAAAMVKMLREE